MTKNKETSWQHLTAISDQVKKVLIEEHNLPEDYFKDAFDPDEIARSENLDREIAEQPGLVILEYPSKSKKSTQIEVKIISFFILPHHIITLGEEEPVFLNKTYQKLYSEKVDYDPIDFVLDVSLNVAKDFVQSLKVLNAEINRLRNQVISTSSNDELYDLIDINKSLVAINASIENNHDMVAEWDKIATFTETIENRARLRDVTVEIKQAKSMGNQALQLTDHLNDIISNVISNNLNNIMKVLTSITIILTVPTIISGFWGMNVGIPWETHNLGFLFTVILTIIITVIVIQWLKNNRFL